jgi:hypothetical protein
MRILTRVKALPGLRTAFTPIRNPYWAWKFSRSTNDIMIDKFLAEERREVV